MTLQTSADLDPLTGLSNRRRLFAELAEAITQGRALVLALIDLDHFKHFNAHNGHRVGDEVLSAVPGVITPLLAAGDGLYRHAGQVFAATIAGDVPAATLRAEQIRAAIERTLAPPQLEHCGDPYCLGPVRPLTVSIGLVPLGRTAEETMTLAQETVDRAKSQGRNRVLAR